MMESENDGERRAGGGRVGEFFRRLPGATGRSGAQGAISDIF